MTTPTVKHKVNIIEVTDQYTTMAWRGDGRAITVGLDNETVMFIAGPSSCGVDMDSLDERQLASRIEAVSRAMDEYFDHNTPQEITVFKCNGYCNEYSGVFGRELIEPAVVLTSTQNDGPIQEESPKISSR